MTQAPPGPRPLPTFLAPCHLRLRRRLLLAHQSVASLRHHRRHPPGGQRPGQATGGTRTASAPPSPGSREPPPGRASPCPQATQGPHTQKARASVSVSCLSVCLSDKAFDIPLYFKGGYYKHLPPEAVTGFPQSPRFNLRETGLRFLQRLSGLRQSVKRKKVPSLHPDQSRIPPSSPGHFDDSDRIFFRGFSGVDKLSEYEATRLRPQPTAPPRRKKSKLTRSFSLTYGDIVVNKVSIAMH